jgi:hypothetical protein
MFYYCQIKKGLIVHILDSALGSVASRIISGGLGNKFHGDLIPEGCYTIMLSSIFQGRTKL